MSNFGQDFQRSFKTTFHVTRGKHCGYRSSLRNLQKNFRNRNLKEAFLAGTSKLNTICPDIFLRKSNALEKKFWSLFRTLSVEIGEFWWIISARLSELLLIYPEEFLMKYISSKKEPKICILTLSKNFVVLATFSSTIVKSAFFVSIGTFSESLFLYENLNSYTNFGLNQNNSFIARRFSARLPILHCLYVCRGKFSGRINRLK